MFAESRVKTTIAEGARIATHLRTRSTTYLVTKTLATTAATITRTICLITITTSISAKTTITCIITKTTTP